MHCGRNAQRIVHIPFYPPMENSNDADQLENEEKMLKIRTTTSKAIGYIIALREALKAQETREYIGNHLLPYISRYMPSVHSRPRKCYALVLVAARLVSLIVK